MVRGGGMRDREYKFRIWDEEMKKMKYLNDVHDSFGFKKNGNAFYFNLQAGYSGILMQYTGMRDHKGVEIYEGDIISMEATTPGAPSIVGEVQFEESCYWVVNEKQEKGVRLFQEGVYIEKLGNIYENSDFYNKILKGEK